VSQALAATIARDTLHAILSGALGVADSLRLTGQLVLVQPPPSQPGLLERWGVPAVLLALLGAFIEWRLRRASHELDKRLEDYKLGPAMVLALFTQRSGLLSEVQLKAAQETWTTLSAVQSQLDDLVSPFKTVAVERHAANDIGAAKEALRAQEEVQSNRIRKDNSDLFAIVHRHKPFLPKGLFEKVSAYTHKLLQVDVFLEERRLFLETLHDVPLSDRPAAAEKARDYAKTRDEHVAELKKLAGDVEEEIRRLSTPRRTLRKRPPS